MLWAGRATCRVPSTFRALTRSTCVSFDSWQCVCCVVPHTRGGAVHHHAVNRCNVKSFNTWLFKQKANGVSAAECHIPAEAPYTTTPSAGTVAPGVTRSTSPICSSRQQAKGMSGCGTQDVTCLLRY